MFIDTSNISPLILYSYDIDSLLFLINSENGDIVIDQQLSVAFTSIASLMPFLVRLRHQVKTLDRFPDPVRLSFRIFRRKFLYGNILVNTFDVTICAWKQLHLVFILSPQKTPASTGGEMNAVFVNIS